MEFELGRGKRARRAYGFDEVALVPGGVTLNPDEVDITFAVNGTTLEIPFRSGPPWTVSSTRVRHRDGQARRASPSSTSTGCTRATRIRAEVIRRSPSAGRIRSTAPQKGLPRTGQAGLIAQRIEEIKAAGVPCAVSTIPAHAEQRADRAESRRRRACRSGNGADGSPRPSPTPTLFRGAHTLL